jgi:hypothetical protein
VWHAAFDPLVEFVVLGGDEVDQAGYRTRVLAHLFAAPAALVVSLGAARFLSRRRP